MMTRKSGGSTSSPSMFRLGNSTGLGEGDGDQRREHRDTKRMPRNRITRRWVWGATRQRYRKAPWHCRSEVRRDLGGRRRADPGCGRPRRALSTPRRRRRARRFRHGQGDRRASPTRERVSHTKPGREMDLLVTAGERKACALVAMALHDIGVPSTSFTGSQAGFITDTNHRNAKILEINPTGSARRSPAESFRSWPGRRECRPTRTSPSSAAAGPTPPQLRSPMCSKPTHVSSTPTCPACSRPIPRRVRRPEDAVDQLRRAARDDRGRLPEAGHAFGRSRPQLSVPLHVRSAFTWEPGTWVVEEDPTMEQAVVIAVSHRHVRVEGHRVGVPDRPGIAARLFRALAEPVSMST